MAEVIIGDISAGHDVSVVIGSLPSEDRERLEHIEGVIKGLDGKRDKNLIAELVNAAKGISLKVAEALAIKYLVN
jgi:hypothetical protein